MLAPGMSPQTRKPNDAQFVHRWLRGGKVVRFRQRVETAAVARAST